LRVNGNNLQGTIRDAFSAFSDLRFVDFSENMFTGTLPASIFDVPTVEILYFYSNAITGSIPPNYGNPPNLRDLYIQENSIFGTVPAIQPNQLQLFTEFRLEFNEIEGTMPASVCALRGSDNETDLVTLVSDCGGDPPEIECTCCTACIGPSG